MTLIDKVKNALLFASVSREFNNGAKYVLDTNPFITIVSTIDGVNFDYIVQEKRRGVTTTLEQTSYKLTKAQAKQLVNILNQ